MGNQIRRRRTALALSQERFAELAGLHFTYVSTLEGGKRTPSVDTLARISAALGTTVSTLLGEAEAELGGGMGQLSPPRRLRR